MNARATPACAWETVASGSPTPTVTCLPPASRTERLSSRRSPTSGSISVEIAGPVLSKRSERSVLFGLLRSALAVVRRLGAEQLGALLLVGAPGVNVKSSVEVAENGWPLTYRFDASYVRCGVFGLASCRLARELARVAAELGVDLAAQLASGAAIDGEERDRPCRSRRRTRPSPPDASAARRG